MKFVKFTGKRHLSSFQEEYLVPMDKISCIRKISGAYPEYEVFAKLLGKETILTCKNYEIVEL